MRKGSGTRRISWSGNHTPGSGTVSRKVSSACKVPGSLDRESGLIDEALVEGKIKISSNIKNTDTGLSVSYRSDGRYYAVALANGVVNVYSSKTDNILYQLNKDDKNLPFNDTAATCVRFRPFQSHLETDGSLLSKEIRRKSSATVSKSSDNFLPPIDTSTPLTSKTAQNFQRRRKSSVSALGIRSNELGLLFTSPSTSERSSCPNNLVTASFTSGEIKTFNFMTELCTNTIKEDREILTLDYSKSGATLVSGGGDGAIHLYDEETNSLKCSYKPPFEYDANLLRIYSITFHPDSENELISAGWHRYIQFFDARVPNMFITKIEGPKMIGEGLSFHPSGKEFCAAAWGKGDGLLIYDYAMRRELRNISSNKQTLGGNSSKLVKTSRKNLAIPSTQFYSTRYFLDDFIVLSGAYPGSVAVVERLSGNVLAFINIQSKGVYSVDTMRQNICFVTGEEVAVAGVFL